MKSSTIRWYHYLFLWAFKAQYIGHIDFKEGFGMAYKYKKAFGKTFILDERPLPELTKSFKFPKVSS